MKSPSNRAREDWISRLCTREALSALAKAVRAAARHPVDSAMRVASRRELVRAVRKALVHGPVTVRLARAGFAPSDEPATTPRTPAIELLLTDADADTLRRLVDSWSSSGTVPDDLVGIQVRGDRSEG